jgi:hypothetical protein
MIRSRARQSCLIVSLGVSLSMLSSTSAAQLGSGGVNVLTWHNDTYRTGQNLSESNLTYNSVNRNTFGQICSAALDGQMYAEPLVVTNVTIGGKTYDYVVYVVTQNDTLYAIDGDPDDGNPPCTVIKSLPFLTTSGLPTYGQYPRDCAGCIAIGPIIGILGTPVISISNSNGAGTIYLVTESQDKPSNALTWYDYLYGVDIQSFQVQYAKVCSSGCGTYSSSDFAHDHIQRPGLLFADCGAGCGNYVYVAFSMKDGAGYPYPNGAVLGFNGANLSGGTVFYFQTSIGLNNGGSNGGGIWQSGMGLALGTSDSTGKNWIYVSTANGTFDLNTGSSDAGDSFLKLDPNGLAFTNDKSHYFTPSDQYFRSSNNCLPTGGDMDFGSGGPMLIPDNQLINWPYLAVTGDKEGGLWFINRTSPNGYSTACGNSCTCQQPSSNVQTFWTGTPYSGTNIHGGLAFWEYDLVYPFLDYLFAAAGGGQVIQYPLCASANARNPIDLTTCTGVPVGSVDTRGRAVNFPHGTTPSVTANGAGSSDAVVWTIKKPDGNNPEGTTPGILYAFDALTRQELYDSTMCAGDAIAPPTKFSVPTVANGYVYVGAQELQNGNNNGTGTFYIFGPPTRSC